uniref:TTF-type domain-containing protein n=1 Tax=Kalanchoe fedtschenkoi TaxID=63787 RepID=A0A7N0UEP7_KALFE
MYKYYKRKTPEPPTSTSIVNSSNICEPQIDLENLPADPGLRRKISEYHPNIRDEVRIPYLLKGPCQPITHKFPQRDIEGAKRKFNEDWFMKYKDWLEYSIEKDSILKKQGSGESFVGKRFNSWNKQDRLDMHVGGPASAHNIALQKCKDLMKREQHIDVVMHKRFDKAICDYRTRLLASIDCSSSNKGNFRELLKFLADHNESIDKVVLQNAPGNLKLITPNIQKDISNAVAQEVVFTIIKDIDGDYFSILIDESCDISIKEQMAVAVRYVNKRGEIIERVIGIVHVSDTTALSLKRALDSLFMKYNLTMSRVRGQGYDGASNMRGEFNGLKTLIMKEKNSAFYVHCFAHQLQLTLVAIAKNHDEVASLFYFIGILTGVVGASCKRQDMLPMEDGELVTGWGLNQETNLKKVTDTRWQSHYGVLLYLMVLFPSIINVLDAICESGASSEHRVQAKDLLEKLQTFDFIFGVILMKNVLGVTNELSQALQKKDQDIVNAIDLVRISKEKLQIMRNNEWDSLLEEVSRRNAHSITNLHHYRIEWYYSIIDTQILELNNRFDETNTELLRCMSCLSPTDRFAHFDKDKFSEAELKALDRQLDNYIIDMRREDGEFLELNGISEFAQMLVKTKKDIVYKWVYLLVKLSLILPVATTIVERPFSAMNIIKNRLRNSIGDRWMNDCLLTFKEKDIFKSISNETIYDCFQNLKTHRVPI